MRHKLTIAEQVRGLRRCLSAKQTPDHLRPFIRKRLAKLEPELERERTQRRKRRPGLFDFLGL
jgi:hypothetical protein